MALTAETPATSCRLQYFRRYRSGAVRISILFSFGHCKVNCSPCNHTKGEFDKESRSHHREQKPELSG